MRRLAHLLFALAAACGGSHPAPPPLAKIALPKGSDLKPFDAKNPGSAHPYGMAQLGAKVYVVLGNLHDADYSVAGPGFLVGAIPSQGVTDVIDLGGPDGHQCTNPGFVRTDGSKLYVSCGGDFSTGTGKALVEVDPATSKVSRSLGIPSPYTPYGLAVTPAKVWIGDTGSTSLISVDRASFTLQDGASGKPPPPSVSCPKGTRPSSYAYLADVNYVGTDLYAVCASDIAGVLYRLDPATAAIRGQGNVGASPTSVSPTADGRIAVVCSVDGTLWIGTPGANGAIPTSLAYTYASATAAPQDVRGLGSFLFTTASQSNTVQKIDITTLPAKVVAEVNTGEGTGPYGIVPIDLVTAMVSDSLSNDLARVDFSPASK